MNSWYKLNRTEIFKKINCKESGLSENEIIHNRINYGINAIPKSKKENILITIIKQLIDPIILILVFAIIFSFIIGENIDAFAIIFIIMIDIIMGTYQERKALKTAESLANMIEVNAIVLRDGKEMTIHASELVVGDIIYLTSGDKVSADIRILESINLTVDESILTGESNTIAKISSVIDEDKGLAERKNMLYSGTSIATGRAKGVVVAVGIATELGKIADQVNNSKDEKSPLTIRMNKFSKQISALVLVVAIIIAILLYTKSVPVSDIFLSVIALSVSAMPEGLPLALTLALTIASNKMAKKKVIVKKLNAVESLGSCTVIASDKTGTLTKNEQTAKIVLLPNDTKYEISGSGYNDIGEISTDTKDLSYLNDIVFYGMVNNEAHITKEFIVSGDSIDIAFLCLAKKLKIDNDYKEIFKIPYESENKYSAMFFEDEGKYYCTIKGSIEKVLSFSKTMQHKKIDLNKINEQNSQMAGSGYRVIAIATKEVKKKDTYSEKDICDMDFKGLVGFIDPVRPEVIPAIKECQNAGIKVVMITGDHPLTAYAIASDLKMINNYDELATGEDIDLYSSKGKKEFDDFIKTKKVFARVTPLNKLEIVESYKRQGEFIAVTGDGVNDSPALKRANIGIAMGSGTDVAKETSKMIIMDDNFTSIVVGIKEGRNAYNNIRKISYLLLSCGIAEVLFFVLSIAFNLSLPLVAIQLLWLNIVTDGLQDMALSFEKSDKQIMKEKPRSTKDSIFNKKMLKETLLSGGSIGIIIFIVWFILIKQFNFDIKLARTYIMLLMVFMQNMHVLNCRSENTSIFKYSSQNYFVAFSIISAIILQIIIMEVPIFNDLFQTVPLSFLDILRMFLISLSIILIMEVYKFIGRRQNKKLN